MLTYDDDVFNKKKQGRVWVTRTRKLTVFQKSSTGCYYVSDVAVRVCKKKKKKKGKKPFPSGTVSPYVVRTITPEVV